ncbi:MAG: hypothetical protein WBA16_03780 [Nonlabens sp.]
MRKLKLIWDFKGPDSLETARHHLLHLDEYVQQNQIVILKSGTEPITANHHIAYVACLESTVTILRDSLKPRRAQLFTE